MKAGRKKINFRSTFYFSNPISHETGVLEEKILFKIKQVGSNNNKDFRKESIVRVSKKNKMRTTSINFNRTSDQVPTLKNFDYSWTVKENVWNAIAQKLKRLK